MATGLADGPVILAEAILAHTTALSKRLSQLSTVPPSNLAAGAHSTLWSTSDSQLGSLRSDILDLTERLTRLLLGPHGFLHEYVSTSWELGALYTLLDYDVLENIPLPDSETAGAPSMSSERLAEVTGLPADKLLRICRLVASAGILEETEEGRFGHTAVSEELVRDKGFRSWVGFQLYETRVASVHLADSLRTPNSFWMGQAAFEHAWGMPMYDWHKKHPEKGQRFARAMESVAHGLDPGTSMIVEWLTGCVAGPASSLPGGKGLVVDLAGATGSFCIHLATLFPDLQFEVRDASSDILRRGQQALPPALATRLTFRQFDPRSADCMIGDAAPGSANSQECRQPGVLLLRSALWGLPDEEAVALLRGLVPVLRQPERPTLVICDLVSPEWGTFAPHIERAYRRRDVTLMTMHDAKQRTKREWAALIGEAVPGVEAKYSEGYTSHSCRGLWEIRLGPESSGNTS